MTVKILPSQKLKPPTAIQKSLLDAVIRPSAAYLREVNALQVSSAAIPIMCCA